MHERVGKAIGQRAVVALDAVNALATKVFGAASGDEVWILTSEDDTGDAGFEDCVGAGGLLTLVSAGFESDKNGATTQVVAECAGSVNGVAFGVDLSKSTMMPDAQYFAIAPEDRSDKRVGLDVSFATQGGFGGTVE